MAEVKTNKSIVVSWIGTTDVYTMGCWRYQNNLPLSKESFNEVVKKERFKHMEEKLGFNGPIRTITDSLPLEKVYLLCSVQYIEDAQDVKEWVSRGTDAPVEIVKTEVTNPTDYDQIIKALNYFYDNYWNEKDSDKYIFNMTPGTPAMSSITLYMVPTRFTGSHLYKTIDPKYVKDGQPQFTEVKLPFSLPSQLVNFSKFIEQTTAQDELKQRIIKTYARYPSVSILLLGQSGVGKSSFAREIHLACGGNDNNFITVNCGELAAGGDGNMFRAALFGAKKGSYTGCVADMTGAFENAAGGTLFLDEIGEVPLNLQPVLLRAIQDKVIQRVGESKDTQIKDLRIITATNKDLVKMVEDNFFREDLYYRISMCPVQMPSLQEIALKYENRFKAIIEDLLEKIRNDEASLAEFAHLSSAAYEYIRNYPWPGNIRQLSHVLLLSCMKARFRKDCAVPTQKNSINKIEVEDIQAHVNTDLVPIMDQNSSFEDRDDFIPHDLEAWLEDKKIQMVKKALSVCNQNIARSAKMLGMTYQKLDYFKKQNEQKLQE